MTEGTKGARVVALARKGLSDKGIAAILGMTKSCVGGHLSYARKKGVDVGRPAPTVTVPAFNVKPLWTATETAQLETMAGEGESTTDVAVRLVRDVLADDALAEGLISSRPATDELLRVVLVAYGSGHFTPKEIADRLGLRPDTIRDWLNQWHARVLGAQEGPCSI